MKHHVIDSTSADEQNAIDNLVVAFAMDPMTRWVWSNLSDYLAAMPDFIRAFGGKAFSLGSAHITEDRRGAALWLPPDTHPDEEQLGAIIEKTVPQSRQLELFKVLDLMGAFHPDEPHWYLPLIGVDPMYQGNGHGSALLEHALRQCDKERCKAYLESSNPRNIALYQRHGFQALGEIQNGTSPTMVPMLRSPK
ncbi:MAG: GNAT family N-acetyltransferase [Puniceicoccales bacterium]